MKPQQLGAYTRDTCKAASKAGIELRMDATKQGHEWEWSNGWSGDTTTHSKAWALLYACEDYNAHREQETINNHFAGMAKHFKQ